MLKGRHDELFMNYNNSMFLLNKKLLIGLAPMDGVTDAAFRFIVDKYGKPDLMYTEFISVTAVDRRLNRIIHSFDKYKTKTPVIAQLIGKEPELFYKATIICCQKGFQGVDVNMGCPDVNIIKKGAGAALMKDFKLTKKIINEVRKAVWDWYKQTGDKLSVSVKTRICDSERETKEMIINLIDCDVNMIAIHGRSPLQGYSGKADWEAIGNAAKLTKETIMIIGNGDIKSADEGRKKAKEYDLDGVLIARAALGNPWLFKDKTPTEEERFKVMMEHVEKFKEFRPELDLKPMRKHLAWYCKGFDGASVMRQKMQTVNTVENVQKIIKSSLSQ